MTVAIAYNPGAYGTYLEWALTTLTSKDSIVNPFTSQGSSHNFIGHQLKFSNWKQYVNSGNVFDFVRFHPKNQKYASVSANLDAVCESVNFLIYLYPDKNSVLLCINNWYSKIYKDWWSVQFSSYINPKKIYNNWPVEKTTKIKDVPRWIKREFLSFYLMPGWFDQVEWQHLDTWHHKQCCVVTVSDLLYNFEKTLIQIESFCNLKYMRPIVDLIPFHAQNLKNQKYLYHDVLCNNIIRAITNNQDCSWESLSLPSEAWVQWQLRNLGYEIRCHELDIFPTNSVHLKELLYNI